MADSHGAPSAIAKAGGALLALVYVLPLTGAVLFAIALTPMHFPRGWPADTAAQAWALLIIFLRVMMLPSVFALWYLVAGFLRRGAGWVMSRSRWLLWGAMVAPLAALGAVALSAYWYYQSSLTDAGRAMGDAYWSQQTAANALHLGWSLLFLLGIALVRFSAKRRTL